MIKRDGERIHYNLFRNLTRTAGYDCVMTLRTSNGLVVQEYYSGAGKQECRDLSLSCIDADKTLAVIFK